MAAIACAAGAVTVAALVSAGAGGRPGEARAQAEVLRPATIAGWSGRPASRRVRLVVVVGVCGKGPRITSVHERRRAVRVRAAEAFDAAATDRPCPALARFDCRTIRLRAPLAHRTVIDARTGVEVPRAGRRGVPLPARCPPA